MVLHTIRMPHLRCFLAVAREGNITRAAEALGSLQPSVSRSIREIEDIVGTPLFVRTGTGLVLTPAGETLHRHVAGGIGQINLGLKAVTGQALEKRVVVYALPNVVRTIMPGAVARFSALYPDVEVTLLASGTEPMTSRVREGIADFGFGRLHSAPKMDGLQFEHLYSEPLCFFVKADHPLASRGTVSLADINEFQVVVPLPGTIIRDELNQYLVSQGMSEFARMIETLSFEFSRNYMQRSDAVVFHPKGAMRIEADAGKSIMLPVGEEALMGPVGLTIRAGETPHESAQLLMQMIREEVSTFA